MAPAGLLEMKAPTGFETYFREPGQILAHFGPPERAATGARAARSGMTVFREHPPGSPSGPGAASAS